MTNKIEKINEQRAREIIFNMGKEENIGKFWLLENMYVGIDNSTGDAWTEEFDSLFKCLVWLGSDELDKQIRVYNDNQLVSECTIGEFLEDNQDSDEFIQDEIEKIFIQDIVEMECFHSGSWRIEAVKELSKLEQFKRDLRLKAWAHHKAEREGTRTFDLNHKWINDKEFRASLVRKWKQIALEKQDEILSM